MSIMKNNKVIAVGDVNTYRPPILSCQWSDHIINDIQWLRADTFSWQSGDVYKTVYDKLVEEYATGAEETYDDGLVFKRTTSGFRITTADYEDLVLTRYNQTGNRKWDSWFYILDTTNKRFKLPRTKWGFKGLRTKVGNGISESLPNIKAEFKLGSNTGLTGSTGTSGAFYITGTEQTYGLNGTSNATFNKSLGFDASRSSSTYQDNAPVQERATQMYLYFYVGEFAQTAIEQTAGLNSEMFNGKLDVSTYNANPRNEAVYLKTTYVSGTSGYNIWSNGYCEQWGQLSWDGAWTTISLVKTFANSNYQVFCGGYRTDKSPYQAMFNTKDWSASAFNIWSSDDTSNNNALCRWRACGYLAAGQY